MIALTLKQARVSGYGNGAINLNEDRVSLLLQHATLECGVTACTPTYGKPIPLVQKCCSKFFIPATNLSLFFLFSAGHSHCQQRGNLG